MVKSPGHPCICLREYSLDPSTQVVAVVVVVVVVIVVVIIVLVVVVVVIKQQEIHHLVPPPFENQQQIQFGSVERDLLRLMSLLQRRSPKQQEDLLAT